MHPDQANSVLIQSIYQIAVEFLMRILVGMGILRCGKIEYRVGWKLKKRLADDLVTEGVNRRYGIFDIVEWAVINLPASLQIAIFPHLKARVRCICQV